MNDLKINRYPFKTFFGNFIYKIIIIILTQLLSIWLIKTSNYYLKTTGVILFGLIQAHSIQILHQCSHFLGFKNKKLNDFSGFIIGLPVFINFQSYRHSHFQHHRALGTKDNKEFFGFDSLKGDSKLIHFVPYIFGLSKYRDIIKDSFESNFFTLKSSMVTILLPNICIAIALIFSGNSDIFVGWILSLILITEPVHFFIEIPEHYGCKKISNEKYENTRTIKSASLLAKWFTNWNNFHVEHHLYRWIFPEHLEDFYNDNKANQYGTPFKNYLEFYSFFVQDILQKRIKK